MKKEMCKICEGKKYIKYFLECDDAPSIACPKCNGGSWKKYRYYEKRIRKI